jgi:hypothetical protein
VDLGSIGIEVDKMSIKLTCNIAVFLVIRGRIKRNVSSSKMSKVADMGKCIKKFYIMSFNHLSP